MATVRATIAGNAPQPPALAFLRAGRVRARPAVPRPCKAVLRALQASVNPARIPANIAATYPATVCQSFRQHRTRQASAPVSGSTVGKDSGKPWQTRRNRSGLSAISASRPATYPASRGGSTCAACQRFGSPRRIPPRPCAGFRQASGDHPPPVSGSTVRAGFVGNLSGKPSAPPIFRACIL